MRRSGRHLPANARWCLPPPSPKPRSLSMACALSSTAAWRDCRNSNPPTGSPGWKPCVHPVRQSISEPAAPGEPSPASHCASGEPNRRRRWKPSPRRKSSKPILPASCSIAPPGALPIRRALPFSTRRRLLQSRKPRRFWKISARWKAIASRPWAMRCARWPCRRGLPIWC